MALQVGRNLVACDHLMAEGVCEAGHKSMGKEG